MPSRRKFLQTASGMAVSLSLAGCPNPLESGPETAQWQASVGATIGMPGPVVANGLVATTGSRDGDHETGRVDAFETGSGKRRWSVDIGRPTGLAADEDAVYAGVKTGTRRGRVLAFDASAGEELWRTEVRNLASALTVADGTLYAANGTLAAIDVADGSKRWEVDERGGADFTIVVAPDDQLAATGDQVVYGDQHGVVSLSPGDASLRWQWRPDEWGSTDAGPYLTEERAYVGSEFRHGAVALDANDGAHQWSHSFGADARTVGLHGHDGGLVVATGTGFGRDGFGTVVVLGDEGYEHQETRFDAPVSHAVGASDMFVVATGDGSVAGLDAGFVRNERWRASFDDEVRVATDGEFGFAQTTGGTLWALGDR